MPVSTPDPARGLAVDVLVRVEADAAFADAVLGSALGAAGLEPRDRGLATRLVYGTLAWQGLLDWHLATLAGREPARLDLPLRVILRLGLYQLLLLERVPPHAAVSSSVELAKARAPRAAGLVNAVLRRADRERARLPLPDPAANPIEHLAVAYSHPPWLVARWREQFAEPDLRALLAADNEAAPTVLRARVGQRDALRERLADAGIETEPGRFAPEALVVRGHDPHALPGFAEGRFSVQSEASQLVALLVAPAPGMAVLDACAAPGGKATYLAELLDGRGAVVALDRHRPGLARAAAAARRLGLPSLTTIAADCTRPPPLAGRRFDRILVDAPCSGLGTLREHPEIRWARGPDDPRRLATVQGAMLRAVAPLVRSGGALVYATCTLSADENEAVVDAWLAESPDFEREDARAVLPASARGLADAQGTLRTLPHRDGLDGFFAVRVRRR